MYPWGAVIEAYARPAAPLLKVRVGQQWYLVALFLSPALLFMVSLVMHGGAALTPCRNHAAEIVTVYLMVLVILGW